MAVKAAAASKSAPKPGAKTSSSKSAAATKAKKASSAASTRASAAAARKAKALVGAGEVTAKALDDLSVPGLFPLDALESIRTPTQAGQVYRLDGGFLDALRLQLRRIVNAEGTPGLRLSFKISGPSRKEFEARLEKKKAKHETISFSGAKIQKKGKDSVLVYTKEKSMLSSYFSSHKAPGTGANPSEGLVLEGQGWRLEFVPPDGPKALRGAVSIELHGSEAEQQKALAQVIQAAGLQPVFAPCNDIAIRRYAMMKLLWTLDPDGAEKLSKKGVLSNLKLSVIETALGKAGASKTRIDALRYEEVAPGHFTVLDPTRVVEMKKKGFRFAYSTVATPEHVLSILQHGQKATLTRWAEGMLINGMSSMADVGSGGAEGVFSRLVTTGAKDKSWTGRTFKILLKPELLERTDIWGWPGDFFGRSWGLGKENFGVDLVEKINASGYASYNEIISPVGNDPRFIGAVVATSEADRTRLITYLQKNKYKPPGGGSLQQFVRVSSTIDPQLLGTQPAAAKPKKKAPKKKVS